MDNIEQDFYDAIKRIQLDRCQNIASHKLKGEQKPVKLTISNVALEAGRSRTLIGHKDCPYPKLRAYIIRIIKQNNEIPASNQQEANRRFREKNNELSIQLSLARSEQANIFAYCIRLEKEVEMLKIPKEKVRTDNRSKKGIASDKVVNIFPPTTSK